MAPATTGAAPAERNGPCPRASRTCHARPVKTPGGTDVQAGDRRSATPHASPTPDRARARRKTRNPPESPTPTHAGSARRPPAPRAASRPRGPRVARARRPLEWCAAMRRAPHAVHRAPCTARHAPRAVCRTARAARRALRGRRALAAHPGRVSPIHAARARDAPRARALCLVLHKPCTERPLLRAAPRRTSAPSLPTCADATRASRRAPCAAHRTPRALICAPRTARPRAGFAAWAPCA